MRIYIAANFDSLSWLKSLRGYTAIVHFTWSMYGHNWCWKKNLIPVYFPSTWYQFSLMYKSSNMLSATDRLTSLNTTGYLSTCVSTSWSRTWYQFYGLMVPHFPRCGALVPVFYSSTPFIINWWEHIKNNSLCWYLGWGANLSYRSKW